MTKTTRQDVPVEITRLQIAFREIAIKEAFKDAMPRLPKKINEETLRGWKSRFSNWRQKLAHRMNSNQLDRDASVHSFKARANAKRIEIESEKMRKNEVH